MIPARKSPQIWEQLSKINAFRREDKKRIDIPKFIEENRCVMCDAEDVRFTQVKDAAEYTMTGLCLPCQDVLYQEIEMGMQ